jgi:hypothetical protein
MELKVLRWLFLASAIINLGCWLWLYFGIPAANFPFIIKYTIGSPSDFWGTRSDLFLVPFLGLIIICANAIVSYGTRLKNLRLSLIMAGAAGFCQILVLLYTVATIYVNTY